MCTWTNILLHCEIFQSYQSIVAPNEANLTRNNTSKPSETQQCEGANFLLLQKRYVKIFLNSYNRAKNLLSFPFSATTAGVEQFHQRALCFIDSDFDTQDEEYGDDIEEIISNQDMLKLHTPHEYPLCDDSSDEVSQVEALSNFKPSIGGGSSKNTNKAKNKINDIFFKEIRSKKRVEMAMSTEQNLGQDIAQEPPINKLPNVDHEPPVNKAPAVVQEPPVSQAPTVVQEAPINKDPIVQKPPVNQAPTVVQEPPVNKAPTVAQEQPVSKAPTAVKEQPVNKTSSSAQQPQANKPPANV